VGASNIYFEWKPWRKHGGAVLDLASEMLFSILFASLDTSASSGWKAFESDTLAGLPTFCPMTFHLLASYSLIACSRAALYNTVSEFACYVRCRVHLIFGKVCIMHVLLLD
jgi:hypothetical protein